MLLRFLLQLILLFVGANVVVAQVFSARVPEYTGYIATRGTMFVSSSTVDKQLMTRFHVVARGWKSTAQLVIPTYYSTPSENAIGSTATITASIEYPANTCTVVKFGGATSVVAPAGVNQFSDPVTLNSLPPDGADVWIRIYWVSTWGIIFNNQVQDSANGDVWNGGVSGIADHTADCGAITNSGNGSFGPVAILGPTTASSVYIIGDSRAAGDHDSYSGTSSDIGEIARSIGPSLAYVNGGVSGNSASNYISSHTLQAQIGSYATHVIQQLTINDVRASASAATIETNLTTINSYFPNAKIWLSTTAPNATSTDNWETIINQTATGAPSEPAVLNAVNDWKRTVPSGFIGFFEVANVLMSAQDSDLWICGPSATCFPPTNTPGTAQYATADGLHESPTGYLLVQSSGTINPALLTR